VNLARNSLSLHSRLEPLYARLLSPRCFTCLLNLQGVQWVRELVVVRVSWPGHPGLSNNNNNNKYIVSSSLITLGLLKIYMIINLRTCKINWDTRKLIRISILIKNDNDNNNNNNKIISLQMVSEPLPLEFGWDLVTFMRFGEWKIRN
jgi:hypothetical protein